MEIKRVCPEDRGQEFADSERYFYYCPISGINLMDDIRSLDLPKELIFVNYSQGEEPIYVSDEFMKQYLEYENSKNHTDYEAMDIQDFLEQQYSEKVNLIKYHVVYPDGENEWTDYIYRL